MSKSRNWCFTLNNPKKGDRKKLYQLVDDEKVTYLVEGKEVGEKGTPHIQGYLEYHTSVCLKTLKNIIGDKFHWEIRRGTGQQASDYCKKDGDWDEWGTMKNPNGNRKDWSDMRHKMEDGEGIKTLLDDGYDSLQCLQYLERVAKYAEKPRNFKPYVIWIWGDSGVGKSKWANDNFPDAYWAESFQWWDGYDQHEVVVIDDYRADFCKFHELLKLIDRYPHKIPIKGGYRQLKNKVFVFTSPKSPDEIWEQRTEEDLKQLMRRIDYVHYLAEHRPVPEERLAEITEVMSLDQATRG